MFDFIMLITTIAFWIGVVYLYFLFERITDNLNDIEDDLHDVRKELQRIERDAHALQLDIKTRKEIPGEEYLGI